MGKAVLLRGPPFSRCDYCHIRVKSRLHFRATRQLVTEAGPTTPSVPGRTRKALEDRIGIAPDGVKYHLGKLKEAGRIRHVGPTKKGRWEVLESSDE